MPVLSVSRKLRRATAWFVHSWIEQFVLEASLSGKGTRFSFVRRSNRSTSDFEPLRKARQNSAACLCDYDYVFDAHATQSGIVQSGLNR
jgi:hypothetical protein